MASPNPKTLQYWKEQGTVLYNYATVTSAGTNNENYWAIGGNVMFPGIIFVTTSPVVTSTNGFFAFM
jgi:hypothetical protein